MMSLTVLAYLEIILFYCHVTLMLLTEFIFFQIKSHPVACYYSYVSCPLLPWKGNIAMLLIYSILRSLWKLFSRYVFANFTYLSFHGLRAFCTNPWLNLLFFASNFCAGAYCCIAHTLSIYFSFDLQLLSQTIWLLGIVSPPFTLRIHTSSQNLAANSSTISLYVFTSDIFPDFCSSLIVNPEITHNF